MTTMTVTHGCHQDRDSQLQYRDVVISLDSETATVTVTLASSCCGPQFVCGELLRVLLLPPPPPSSFFLPTGTSGSCNDGAVTVV